MTKLPIAAITLLVTLALASCSFSNDPRMKPTTEFVLHKTFYLSRIKYSDSKLTDLRLWSFYVKGDDGIHYKIGQLPTGTSIFVYGNLREKSSFYNESYFEFFGTVRYRGADYFFKGGMSQSDFLKLGRPWEGHDSSKIKQGSEVMHIKRP